MSSSTVQYIRNPNAADGFLRHVQSFLEQGEGAVRIQKLASDVLSLGVEIERSRGKSLVAVEGAAQVFDTAARGFTIPLAGSATISAYQAGKELAQSEMTRPKALDFFQKAADSISLVSNSVLFFTSSAVAKVAGDVFGVFADVGDMLITNNQLALLKGLDAKSISKEAKEAVSEEKTLFYIKLAKTITAVAGGIIGLVGLVLGSSFVPLSVLLVFSIASNSFAIGRYFYDKNRSYSDEALVSKIKGYELRNR